MREAMAVSVRCEKIPTIARQSEHKDGVMKIDLQ